MNIEILKNIVEGFLFASEKPLSVEQIVKLFPEGEQPEKESVLECIELLMVDFEGHGIELKKIKSGYRFQVRQETASWVSRLWDEKPAKYTRAMLETLALIVYRQPITRGEIEEVRGVSVSSHIIRTMIDRDWVKVIGHRDVPGRPALYASTKEFLDYFNLSSLEELPPLSEIKDLDSIATELDPEQNAALISAIRDMQKENASDAISITTADNENDASLLDAQNDEDAIRNRPDEILMNDSTINKPEDKVDGSVAEHADDNEIRADNKADPVVEEDSQKRDSGKSFSDLISNFEENIKHHDAEDDNPASDTQKKSVESDT